MPFKRTEQLLRMSDGAYVYASYQTPKKPSGIPIVLCDGLGCDGYIWKYIIPHFAKKHPILHWNYRGHGYSEVPSRLSSINVKRLSKDLANILQHFAIEKAIFCGHSMGTQILLDSYPLVASKVERLIFLCGSYGSPMETWHANFRREGEHGFSNWLGKQYFDAVMNAAKQFPDKLLPLWRALMRSEIAFLYATRFEVNGKRIKREDFMPYLEHLSKMEPRVFAQTAQSLAKHNAKHILPSIQHPTLIIGGGKDTFSPGWLSEDMHHLIPHNEFTLLKEGSHTAPLEYPHLICTRMQRFIQKDFKQPSHRNSAELLA